jgi:hypothetical protein
MSLKPMKKLHCYFILDIGNEAFLLDHDPSERMTYPEDDDHLIQLHREKKWFMNSGLR